MELEKAIQQKRPFASEAERVLVNILYTRNYLNNRMAEFFKTYGLTIKQYNILRILKGAGQPISTALIRERMIDRMSDSSRIVDRMEKKDLISKTSCPSDKRKVDVIISEKGMKLLQSMESSLQDFNTKLIHLNQHEAQSLSGLLDQLRNGK